MKYYIYGLKPQAEVNISIKLISAKRFCFSGKPIDFVLVTCWTTRNAEAEGIWKGKNIDSHCSKHK